MDKHPPSPTSIHWPSGVWVTLVWGQEGRNCIRGWWHCLRGQSSSVSPHNDRHRRRQGTQDALWQASQTDERPRAWMWIPMAPKCSPWNKGSSPTSQSNDLSQAKPCTWQSHQKQIRYFRTILNKGWEERDPLFPFPSHQLKCASLNYLHWSDKEKPNNCFPSLWLVHPGTEGVIGTPILQLHKGHFFRTLSEPSDPGGMSELKNQCQKKKKKREKKSTRRHEKTKAQDTSLNYSQASEQMCANTF